MPERTGLDVQAELARRTPAPPVVFLTGHGNVRRGVEAMRAGAADFLEKPAARDELLASVDVALRESAHRAAAHAAAEEARHLLERLTPRERQVCDLVAQGRLNREISVALGCAVKTIKVHRAHVKSKLGVSSVAELVRFLGRARGDG
jgi:FixJ family two-component response regulator